MSEKKWHTFAKPLNIQISIRIENSYSQTAGLEFLRVVKKKTNVRDSGPDGRYTMCVRNPSSAENTIFISPPRARVTFLRCPRARRLKFEKCLLICVSPAIPAILLCATRPARRGHNFHSEQNPNKNEYWLGQAPASKFQKPE